MKGNELQIHFKEKTAFPIWMIFLKLPTQFSPVKVEKDPLILGTRLFDRFLTMSNNYFAPFLRTAFQVYLSIHDDSKCWRYSLYFVSIYNRSFYNNTE